MEKQLIRFASNLQETIEKTFNNEPTGICYLTGYCMTEILITMGYKTQKVTGKLALKYKNIDKYAVYGNLKGSNVGDYHTWCEVYSEGKLYIIDPSLKYNKKALKDLFNIKLSDKIPNILVTDERNTFNWKYIQEDNLESKSLFFLHKISDSVIQKIISNTLEKSNPI
jgi:hypothetical protein